MSRQAFVLHDQRTIIFWSRKAGNTSLAEWIYDVATKGKEVRAHSSARRTLQRDFIIGFTAAYDLIQKERYTHFVLARNPYDRIVSAYVNKFVWDGGRPRSALDQMESFARDAAMEIVGFLQSETPWLVSKSYNGVSFQDFVAFLVHQVHDRRGREPLLNNHWNTQVPFFFNARFRYTNIIKLEQIAEDIQPLAHHLGISEPFPQLRNTVGIAGNAEQEDHSTLTSVEMTNAGIVPTRRTLLTPASRTAICEAFRIDFDKFEYPS